jgi:hypothetical protein
MAKPLGSSKTGGRQKGVPNKKTAFLCESLSSLECDVPTRILELMPSLPPDRQADIWLELLQYLYPKRKPIDSNSEHSSASQQVVVNVTSEADKKSVDERKQSIKKYIRALIQTDEAFRGECKRIIEGIEI